MKQRQFCKANRAGIIAVLALACLPLVGTAQEGAEASPVGVIETAAEGLQKELTGRQKYFTEHPDELYALIDRVLLTNFDVQYAGKQVLGKKHWTSATEEQRERFITAFYTFLVKTYAKGILEFDQDNLVIDPEPSYSKDGKKSLVRTELIIEGDNNVQVNYAARATAEGWKIYDVRIEGVSYIQNYRNQFDAEISAQGIDTVIARLEAEAEAAGLESIEETESPEQAET